MTVLPRRPWTRGALPDMPVGPALPWVPAAPVLLSPAGEVGGDIAEDAMLFSARHKKAELHEYLTKLE